MNTTTLTRASRQWATRPADEVRSVWDAAQAVTAFARTVPHQDRRVDLERRAGALLEAA